MNICSWGSPSAFSGMPQLLHFKRPWPNQPSKKERNQWVTNKKDQFFLCISRVYWYSFLITFIFDNIFKVYRPSMFIICIDLSIFSTDNCIHHVEDKAVFIWNLIFVRIRCHVMINKGLVSMRRSDNSQVTIEDQTFIRKQWNPFNIQWTIISTRGINLAPISATYFLSFRFLSICIASDITVFNTRRLEHQDIRTRYFI